MNISIVMKEIWISWEREVSWLMPKQHPSIVYSQLLSLTEWHLAIQDEKHKAGELDLFLLTFRCPHRGPTTDFVYNAYF